MTYVPLSLKYRPGNFDEVAGQEHVTTTLRNAVSLGKIANAYLFAGPRGTGKTSTARILAKSLNCEKAPTPAPCGECDTCREIAEGRSFDVLEIDGASNRGIDEIRNLRENVKFSPAKGKYKIYIVDEVHMLTVDAFNALLKTLEEPPPHVKFIFATTRIHKVLPTIISRCQRFDFRRLPVRDIIDNLKDISEKENINVKDEALFLIAKSADGSMRDAQVILDQLNAFSKAKVEIETVRELLGIIPQDAFFAFADAISAKDAQAALKVLDSLIASGKEAFAVAIGLVNHFRNMMILKLMTDYRRYLVLTEDDIKRLEEGAKHFSPEDILYIIYTITAAMELIKKTSLARIPLEVALVKIIRAPAIKLVAELLEKVSKIEACPEPLAAKEVPAAAAPPAPAPVPKISASETDEGGLFQQIKSRWYEVMNYIKNKKMSVASFLMEAGPVELKNNKLIIGFGKNARFHMESLDSVSNRKIIQDAISEIIKKDLGIDFMTVEYAEEAESPGENGSFGIGSGPAPSRKVEPIVESALDMFDGKVVRHREKES